MLCVRESVTEEYSCISSISVYLLRKSTYMHVQTIVIIKRQIKATCMIGYYSMCNNIVLLILTLKLLLILL